MRVINDKHQDEQRLAFLSRFDELTGQMNRSRLGEVLDAMIETARCYRSSLAFLLAGIDDLAIINDAFGYGVADEVIAGVARRIRTRMRAGDGLGRVSGNKFGIIINKCELSELPIVAQRFIDVVGQDVFQTAAGPIAARISIGAVMAPRNARNARRGDDKGAGSSDRRQGDAARKLSQLCAEPQAGRGAARQCAADRRHRQGAERPAHGPRLRADRVGLLAEAALHECLVRLRRDDGSLVPASAIVPISEKLGIVRLIDHRVLELAIEELVAHPQARCTINLSAATASDQDWLTSLAMRLHPVPEVAARLTVEITESAAIANLDTMGRFVRTMKEYGAHVAIDDFGAGHTSFRALRDLAIDMVKIDGAFVQNMMRSPDDRFFVRTLIDLARHLDLEIVAEWVQDEETAEKLTEWGCDYLQGAYLGRASTERPWAALPLRAAAG